MKKYEEKIWNEMITGPSYFDDDDKSNVEPAECLIEHEDWVICMEGRRVYWKFNDFMMGAFTFKPKTWTDKGNEFPQFWPQWLIFRFIGHVWGYHDDNKKDLKPLLEWATNVNN